MFDDGIPFIFGEGLSTVVAVGQTLAAAGAGPTGNDRWCIALLPTGRILFVHHGTTRKRVISPGFIVDGNRQLPPMHQVVAHRMSPVHVAPLPAVRVVLEEEVPHAIVVDHTVGVVVPTEFLREVKLRTERLIVKRIAAGDRVGLLDQSDTLGRRISGLQDGLLSRKGFDVEESPEINGILGAGKLRIKFAHVLAVDL